MAATASASPETQPTFRSAPGFASFVLIACGVMSLASRFGDLWYPVLGFGFAATVWFGLRFGGWLAGGLVLISAAAWALFGSDPARIAVAAVLGAQIVAAAWVYFKIGEGSPRFDDPRSAVLFLILILGMVAVIGAGTQVAVGHAVGAPTADDSLARQLGAAWIGGMLGFLVVGPFSLVVLTRLIAWLDLLPPRDDFGLRESLVVERGWTWGEGIELTGLALANGILSALQVRFGSDGWPLWGVSLLLVVWSSLRQGVRGGTVTAFVGATVALLFAQSLGITPAGLSPLQGNYLAQGAVAILVGSSVGWIRATEARYRHVVGHIPLVLTSVRLHNPIAPSGGAPTLTAAAGATPLVRHGEPGESRIENRAETKIGPAILREAEIVLVSNAATAVLGVAPNRLIGPFSLWLDRVHVDDRDIVIASISQLTRQRQTVTCEYRIAAVAPPPDSAGVQSPEPPAKWVRDTLAPHYTDDGRLDGWDGVVEEISEQRALQQDNRRVAGMLQALVANMPMGVFFVQGPGGQPIMVNTRARQLLGQREDMAAGLAHLSHVYRLHRQDGTEYPPDELPVVKALKYGQICTANDIVVHRPDGRRVPLFTWAAPVDLGKVSRPEAAVWVIEDLSALQQAEFARRETEARLRAVFETLAEGVVVQNKVGIIIEGNPAAAAILGIGLDQLVGRSWLAPERGCLREDGSPFPADQHPDRLAMQIKMPVRNVLIGVPHLGSASSAAAAGTRWILVNSMPLPVGTAFTPNSKGASLVTTFSDVTQERYAEREIVAAKDKYQSLVDTMPILLWRMDASDAIVYTNPAARGFLGASTGDVGSPGHFEMLFDPADQPRVHIALKQARLGKESRFEFGLVSKKGEPKIGLALVHPQMVGDKYVGSSWIVVDLTRQRNLEEELIRAQRLELVGRLASGAVHDFNNLLMGISGTAGILKVDAADRADLVGHVATIEDAADRASKLAEQILTLGKPSPRSTHITDVNVVARSILALVTNMLPIGVTARCQLADEPLLVQADDLPIAQILLNLCLNARDAMSSGGTLELTTRRERRLDCDWVVLAVADTGHGIPAAVREKMFDPFYSTRDRGAGIGLSVVNEIVRRLGGTIDVTTAPGQGTRFEIGLKLVASNS